jgi:hypothetical protein
MAPGISSVNLRATPQVQIQILRDDDHDFRQAKFRLQGSYGCARVEYKAPDSDGGDLNDQVWPNDDSKDRDKVTFTILKGGGIMTFQLQPNFPGACALTLE